MKKKVIDIYSPKEKKEEGVRLKTDKTVNVIKKRPFGGWTYLLLFVFLFFLGYIYYIFYNTEVVVYPFVENYQIAKDVLLRTTGSLKEEEIRGVVFAEKVSETREFPIEGRRTVEKKAEGEIEVCQEYKDTQMNFLEGTRFVSDSGEFFLAKKPFVLPGKDDNGGCSLVEVIAAEPGEDYNISADSEFVLPGLKGTALYGEVKGISFNLKEEGMLKEVPFLDDETMNRAELQMKEDLLEKGISLLKEKYEEDYFLQYDSQYILEVAERTFQEEETEEDDTFLFQLEADIKVMTVGKESVEDFIKSALPESHTWRKETEDILLTFSRINFFEGEADIFLQFSADIYADIDTESIRREVVGLDFETAKEKIKEKRGVENVEIKTKPFGLSRIASSKEKIKVVLEFK